MHFNKKSKGNSVQLCLGVTRIMADGATRKALLSKWYHPRAKVPLPKGDGHTFMPFGTALAQGLVV